MLQKTAARALIVTGFLLAALPACSSEFSNCGLVMVATDPVDSTSVAVGDSVAILATVASACPDKINKAVVFTNSNASVLSLNTVSETATWAKGIAPGSAVVTASGRDRSNVRASVVVTVRSP